MLARGERQRVYGRRMGSAFVAAMAVVTPALSFAGSWLGGWLDRRSARELDRWRRREETMRLVRWASELATDDDDRRAGVGVATMRALNLSEMLQPEDLALLAAVSGAVLADAD